MNEEQKHILKMVESGRISAEEGAKLLKLVSDAEGEDSEQPQPAQGAPAMTGQDERDKYWAQARPFWFCGLSCGLLLLLLGGAMATTMHQQGRVGVWTWFCGWIPLCVGLLIVTLAAWARTAPWIHLRVVGSDDRITISLPLPLGLSAFGLRIARRFVPKLRETGVDEAIVALGDELRSGQPIVIEVEDEEEGEHVQICIG